MINFCTLFDSNYLHFGLSLYKSLSKHCREFHLYVFAFDKKCEDFLAQQNLKNVTVIPLQKFEDKELLSVKSNRSRAEYCWTCTPSTILYVLKNYQVDHCVYLDSDIFFFSDPQVLIDEIPQDKAVLITSHNYLPQYDQSEVSGKYCVQFMYFKNNHPGLEALNWWRERCIEWCYSKPENGKFGDQKYLDDWPVRFPQTHELKNEGGGVAPWNVSQYKVKGNKIYKENGEALDLVFYHFHGFTLLNSGVARVAPTNYKIRSDAIRRIYRPYLRQLSSVIIKIGRNSEFINQVNAKKAGFFKRIVVKLLKRKKNLILR